MGFISANFITDRVCFFKMPLILFRLVCDEAPLSRSFVKYFLTEGTMNFLFVVWLGIFFKVNVAFSEFWRKVDWYLIVHWNKMVVKANIVFNNNEPFIISIEAYQLLWKHVNSQVEDGSSFPANALYFKWFFYVASSK